MIDMITARSALLAAATASAKSAQELLQEEGKPRVELALQLINAASFAIDVASRGGLLSGQAPGHSVSYEWIYKKSELTQEELEQKWDNLTRQVK